jgi:hypothetical protein
MFKIIALVVAAIIALVLVVAAVRPDSFRVERSLVIQAPPQRIYEQIQDFHRWQAWSPYEKLDPAMKREIAGAPSGVGAVYAWDGNRNAGAGRMEIVEAVPASRVRIRLDFQRPMENTSTAELDIVPEGNASRVTWAMHGPAPYVTRLFGLVFDMDKMIGKDLEEGLRNLERITEAADTPAHG